MAQRGIREYDAKRLLAENIPKYACPAYGTECKLVKVSSMEDLETAKATNPWLLTEKLVVKPDQLFGKKGKHGLVLLDVDFENAKAFLNENLGKIVTVGKTTGRLDNFLITPFVQHDLEYFVAIRSERNGDIIYFSTVGGVDIEEKWDMVESAKVPVLSSVDDVSLKHLFVNVTSKDVELVANFVKALYKTYADLGFSYVELNPFTIVDSKIIPLGTVVKIDDTSAFENSKKWHDLQFPAPFGRDLTEEEVKIKRIDEDSGSSLKLTVLNPKGRIWLMVAGGGASVIYTDTVVDLGSVEELGNYGEYSGNPSAEETYQYASTILDLMTRETDPRGKILLIGGGIANFTDVAKTFTGIIQALDEYKDKLKQGNVKIFVRRGGPNYLEGLKKMKQAGTKFGLDIQVYGPETHMTKIVSMALGGGDANA